MRRAGSNYPFLTQKERDNETGLDFFEARYFSSIQGRFTSADDFLNDTAPVDPASWNLYAYVRNNPLRVGDITNATDRDELLRRANYTYGCNSCVTVDKDGFLAVDTAGLSNDVLKATQYLTDAINSRTNNFSVEITNNNSEVAFGDSQAGLGKQGGQFGIQLPGNSSESGPFRICAGGLRIYEAGTDRGSFGTYTATDRLRVGVEGGVVKYRKNGVLLYSSAVSPVYPLLVDTSLNTVNSELIDVVISGAPGGGTPLSFVTSKTLGAQRADSPGWTGFKMTTGAQPVTVTTLGRLCVAAGNSGTHELRLIRVSDNSVVASVNVSMSGCTVGQFKYAALANPLTLLASTAYLLVSYEVGTDTFHDWTGTVLTTTSVATVNHGVYTTNGGQTWGPAGSTGNSYVPVDFQYTVSTAANINWLVTDQLGTPRMVFDKTGSLATVKRHDYLPFGEELFAGAAGRTLADGYVGDNVRQKFTRKERDIETGLDYFLARYHSSSQGRFTSPDPLITSGKVVVPQSWNRYTYCLNNPLAFIDPSGLEWRRNDETGALRWYEKDDDRTGTTEYTNEYYQAPDGQWVHLNMSGPTRNAEDAAFARRGWDFVDAASVPGIYNGANMPSMQAGRGDSTGALQLLFEWVTGTGPTDREFGPSDYMTQGIMTSPDIAAARQAFIDQGGGTYMGGVRFGLNAEDGPFEAGLNMPRQFVGSFNITITEQRNGDAHFVLENATTLKSALYQFPGVQPVERSTMRPLSTKTQTYWWIERGVIKR